MLRKYLKKNLGRFFIAGFCIIGLSVFWEWEKNVRAEEDVLPALIVRADQEAKWGLFDPKLKMPRGKRAFAQGLLEIIHEEGAALDDKDVSASLALSYEEAYPPLDLYRDFADVPNFTSAESQFSDFDVWVGKD